MNAKNYLFPVFVVLCGFSSSAQMNLDSLKTELEKIYIQERGSNDWNAYIIKYLDSDSLSRYILSFNSDGEVEESIWSIALEAHQYDSLGRNVESRYYDINGQLYFSDWPPIIRKEYYLNGKIAAKSYFDIDEKPVKNYARNEYVYDDRGNLIESRMLNAELLSPGERSVTRYEYSNDDKTVTTSYHNGKGDISLNDSTAFTQESYVSSKREKLLSVKTFDQHMKPSSRNEFNGNDFHEIRYTYDLRPGYRKAEWFDLDQKLVYEGWQTHRLKDE